MTYNDVTNGSGLLFWPSRRIIRTFLAPVLSATSNLLSNCIMIRYSTGAFSTISKTLQRLSLLSGRVAMIFTLSPTPESLDSS